MHTQISHSFHYNAVMRGMPFRARLLLRSTKRRKVHGRRLTPHKTLVRRLKAEAFRSPFPSHFRYKPSSAQE
jgi:hypothetical protein